MVFSEKISVEERSELKFWRDFHHFRWLKLPESVTYQDCPSTECWNRRQRERKTKSSGCPRKISGKDERHIAWDFSLDGTACTKSVRLLLSCGTKETFVECKRCGTEIKVCKTNGPDKTRLFLDEGRVLLSRWCKFCPQIQSKQRIMCTGLLCMAKGERGTDCRLYFKGNTRGLWRKDCPIFRRDFLGRERSILSSIRTREWWPFQEHNFNDIFRRCNRPNSRIFIQEGDPTQNSAVARKALNRIGAKLFSIP